MRTVPSSVALGGAFLAGGLLATLPEEAGSPGAQSPPFNDKMELKGSTTFVESNWNINGTGTQDEDAKARMDTGGLTLALATNGPSSPRIQFKRQFIVGDGASWAWLRININDVDNVGFYLGLYSLDPDPRSGEPTYAAYFKKDETDTQVDLRTRNNDGGNTEADKFTISDNTPFELVVKMDGSLPTNKVTFYWRNNPTALWSSQEVTASAPADSAALHFSLMAFNDDLSGTDASLVAEVFESEAPAAGGSSGLESSAMDRSASLPLRFIARDRPPVLWDARRMDDPPDPNEVALEGSMVFDYDAGNPNLGDWDATPSSTGAQVFLSTTGLYLSPATSEPEIVVVQHKQRFTPAAGVSAWARFRLLIDHVDDNHTYFGFFSTSTDPFTGTPSVMATFDTDPHDRAPTPSHSMLLLRLRAKPRPLDSC